MSDVSYVTAGKPKTGGAVARAESGSTLPTTASAALDAAFVVLGYCSEDGLVNSNSPSSDSIKAWGGDTVLNIQTEKPDTFKFTLLEVMNVEVLKAIYGSSNVSGTLTTGITVNANADDQEVASWVFDMILRDGALKRIVVPKAQITEIEDITYADSDAVGYGITLSAMPDSSGNTHYEYILKA